MIYAAIIVSDEKALFCGRIYFLYDLLEFADFIERLGNICFTDYGDISIPYVKYTLRDDTNDSDVKQINRIKKHLDNYQKMRFQVKEKIVFMKESIKDKESTNKSVNKCANK